MKNLLIALFAVAVAHVWSASSARADPMDDLQAASRLCGAEHSSILRCEEALWSFVDITEDGVLSPAELTRLSRTLMQLADKKASNRRPENVFYAFLIGPLASELAVANFDYNDDGSLSKDEVFADHQEGTFAKFIAELRQSGLEAVQDAKGLTDLLDGFGNRKLPRQRTATNDVPPREESNGETQPHRMKVASTFATDLTLIGDLAKTLSDTTAALSENSLELKIFEPNALVPALEVFEAVSTGAVDAGWSSPGYWVGKEPALQIFASVPFGPSASDFLGWFHYGGGGAIYDEIYARHNIKGLLCAIMPPEGGGWFREEIRSLSDLVGLRMRFFGPGARVMERLGVDSRLIAGNDIFPSLELGTIDATEFSIPAIDIHLGFHRVAPHYYLPGWHQQSSFLELMINADVWSALGSTGQAQIEAACAVTLRDSLARGDSLQVAAIEELLTQGVFIHNWPDDVLSALKLAWQEEVSLEAAANPDFAEAWTSLEIYLERSKIWRDAGYLR